MAAFNQNWVRPLWLTALLVCAATPIRPQSASGSLIGKLTDLRSAPLAGATIVLRNQSSGAEIRTPTAPDGAYRFTALDAGKYSLEANSAQLGHGQLTGILV